VEEVQPGRALTEEGSAARVAATEAEERLPAAEEDTTAASPTGARDGASLHIRHQDKKIHSRKILQPGKVVFFSLLVAYFLI
jgi:hypothetical protein